MPETEETEVQRYLRELAAGLGRVGGRTREVLDEVAAGLDDHVRDLMDDGLDRATAERRACSELGNPYELAHHLRGSVAPLERGPLAALRVGMALAVALWALLLLWVVRAGSYGFDARVPTFLVTLHLPVVLFLWPRVVWRWNGLFGLTPGALGAGLVVLLMIVGRSSSQGAPELVVPQDASLGSEIEGPTLATDASGPSPALTWLTGGTATVCVLTVLSLRRRRQRHTAWLLAAAAVAACELPFALEEWAYRQDLARLLPDLESRRAAGEPLPDRVTSRAPVLASDTVHVRELLDGLVLSWTRRLSPGHSLVHDTRTQHTHVQD